MTKSTITRERVVALIAEHSYDSALVDALEHLLAAMDSEPVAVTDDELNAALQLHRLKVDGHSQLSDAFRAGFRYARRTAPQPAPVVPEEKPIPNTLSMYAVDAVAAIAEVKGWNACRAAMLQAYPVCTCPSGDGSLRRPCPVHPGNSPTQSDCCPAQNSVAPAQNSVTPAQNQGWIPVSEQMPEVGDIVLTAMGGVVNVGETECSAANCRFFTSVISGRELPATHWMPLPAAPQKDINALIPLVSRNEQEVKRG